MDETGTNIINNIISRSPAPAVTLDYKLYEHFLEDTGLSEDQKREFLAALWSIICEFVAMGFEVHPVQQAQNACGRLGEARTNPPVLTENEVNCEGSILATDFKKAAGRDCPHVAGRIEE